MFIYAFQCIAQFAGEQKCQIFLGLKNVKNFLKHEYLNRFNHFVHQDNQGLGVVFISKSEPNDLNVRNTIIFPLCSFLE